MIHIPFKEFLDVNEIFKNFNDTHLFSRTFLGLNEIFKDFNDTHHLFKDFLRHLCDFQILL